MFMFILSHRLLLTASESHYNEKVRDKLDKFMSVQHVFVSIIIQRITSDADDAAKQLVN